MITYKLIADIKSGCDDSQSMLVFNALMDLKCMIEASGLAKACVITYANTDELKPKSEEMVANERDLSSELAHELAKILGMTCIEKTCNSCMHDGNAPGVDCMLDEEYGHEGFESTYHCRQHNYSLWAHDGSGKR